MDADREAKPPAKKGVFKGKRNKPKFTRNARTGSMQTVGTSRQRYLDALAAAPATVPSSTQRAIASVTSRAAVSSPTKKELKRVLSKTSKDLRIMAAEQALSYTTNDSLKKKLGTKELTVTKAKAQSIKFKSAARKSERGLSRAERALERERALRHEDAIAAEDALKRERHEFQLCLKAAISEVKVSAFGFTFIHFLFIYNNVHLLKLLHIPTALYRDRERREVAQLFCVASCNIKWRSSY